MSAVSIILCVHNSCAYTQRCLAVLQENLKDRDYELIVVDDASNDGSWNWLSAQSGLQLIHNDSPRGISASFNQGAKVANG